MNDNLAKEFNQILRDSKAAAKERELEEFRDLIRNATEKDFPKMKEMMLLLFNQNVLYQQLLENEFLEKAISAKFNFPFSI